MKDKEKIFKLLREAVETPQESFAVEEMISKIERTMPPIEDVSETQKKFAGYRFYKNKYGKFWCGISMHRFVWQYFNGEIPEGYDVHHRDLNPYNNDISNLQLLTKTEHKKFHLALKRPKAPFKKSKFICAVCGCEYEAVNRNNNTYCSDKCKKIAERARATKIKVCEICGKEFSTSDDARFCSKKCVGEFLKKQETKTCPVCGKTFSALISQNRKHCSPECAAEALRKRETRTCLHCGKEFPARIEGDQKFCSRKCFYEYRNLHPSEYPTKPLNERETRICLQCGKEFPAEVKSPQKFCSMPCFYEYRSLHSSEYPSNTPRNRETRICANCGKEFSAYKNDNQQCCSKACSYNHRKKRETKVCPICGKKFTVKRSSVSKYCSRKCFGIASRKK